MIDIKKLCKNYDTVRALDDLSLHIDKGEFIGLIGPNGAGKTTLLKALMGLVRPESGAIAINGMNIWEKPVETRQLTGYSPEPPVLYDYLTGYEYLQFTGRMRGMNGKNLGDRITDLMQEFALQDKAAELIADYSHGMKKKIAIAAALLAEPPLLLLDEPTGGLDPEIIFSLKKLLVKLHDQGTTIVFSSHILETVEKLCSRVVMINKGKIVADDSIANLYKLYGSDATLEDIFIARIKN